MLYVNGGQKMKALKDISLLALGALIMYVIILGMNLNFRLVNAEKNIGAIVQFINKQQQPIQPKVE